MGDQNIDMTERKLTKTVRLGFMRLSKADELPLRETIVNYSDPHEVDITFWGDTPPPWDDETLVSIRMFRLPDGEREFQRQIEFFGHKRRKRTKLPEGVPFDDSVLRLSFPASWTHQAFARSARDFIHTYHNDQLAMLIRLRGEEGNILDNPLLQGIQKNLRFVEEQWITEALKSRPRRSAVRKTTVQNLDAETQGEIDDAILNAREYLTLGKKRKPETITVAIYSAIEEVRNTKVSAEEKRELAIDLGALWGQTVCQAAGWKWKLVPDDDGDPIPAVCRPRARHVVAPISLMYDWLKNKRSENTSLLLFNMIVAKKLPPAPRDTHCWLS